ncbi:hypothetical protein BC830DRAFT_1084815 [Chytriomyces sp. MP71]|nr:hypothetical protein BC830DRAFT_1084815 [Chytriomyces sp. MP71]
MTVESLSNSIETKHPSNSMIPISFWGLMRFDDELTFTFHSSSAPDNLPGSLLCCLHPNDAAYVVKELAQFMTLVTAGRREALAGCSVRSRFSVVDRRAEATVKPFLPMELLSMTQEPWMDVFMDFVAASKDTLVVFVRSADAPATAASGDADRVRLQRLTAQQGRPAEPGHAHLFVTVVDAASGTALFTSSPSDPRGRGTTSAAFAQTHLDHDSARLFNRSLHRMVPVFALKHRPRTSAHSDGESIVVVRAGLAFVTTLEPQGRTATLSPPISSADAASPVQAKRAFRPWEVEDAPLEAPTNVIDRRVSIPSISSLLTPHVPSLQHARTLSGTHVQGPDAMESVIAASQMGHPVAPVQRVRASYGIPTVQYRIPIRLGEDVQPQIPSPSTTPQSQEAGAHRVSAEVVGQGLHQPQPVRKQTYALLESESKSGQWSESLGMRQTQVDEPVASRTSKEESHSPPLDEEGPKSRPLKPGHCRKCGVRESREWRKGPHGMKTLCNACGLRYKRKPWDILKDDNEEVELSDSVNVQQWLVPSQGKATK